MNLEIKGSLDEVKVKALLLKNEWRLCSHNATGSYPYSQSNDRIGWFRIDGMLEGGAIYWRWVCWGEFTENAFECFLETVPSLSRKLNFIKHVYISKSEGDVEV